jgi:hypothetical protein
LRAELIKFSTLRSTTWTLLGVLTSGVAVTVLSTHSSAGQPPQTFQGFDPTDQSLSGLFIATLGMGVLGVLAATGEYSSGTVRSSLSANPRRPMFFAAKATVVGAVALVIGEVMSFLCFFIGQAVLAGGGAPTAAIGHPGVLRAVMLSGAFIGLLGLFALGLGLAVRHTAGGIAVYAGAILLVPFLLSRLPKDPSRFTPIPMLGNSVAAVVRQPGQLSAPDAFGLMALYCLAMLVAAVVLLLRRDA